ncbi:GMC family oxidoreductase N-terminal domain-containing protein [Vibrio sp. PP-XX7]
MNGYQQEGFGVFDQNIYRGRRLSCVSRLFTSVKNRKNLTVITGATWQKMGILYDGKSRRWR